MRNSDDGELEEVRSGDSISWDNFFIRKDVSDSDSASASDSGSGHGSVSSPNSDSGPGFGMGLGMDSDSRTRLRSGSGFSLGRDSVLDSDLGQDSRSESSPGSKSGLGSGSPSGLGPGSPSGLGPGSPSGLGSGSPSGLGSDPLKEHDLLQSVMGPSITADERFEVLALIGTGACSQVFKARQLQPSRVVALKVLHPHLLTNAETIARFQREAESGSRLNHASICTVYEYGRLSNGQPFIAMQYLEGESLASLLRRFGCLDIEESLPIFISCCNALIAAHEKGIIHRDIKPANIFIQSIGKERDAKLLDFGLAKLLSHNVPTLTQTGIALGTVQYMSPEQILSEPVDARSDIYSLGCVMFQTLTGCQVFEGRTAFEVMEEHINQLPRTLQSANPAAKIPSELENVVLKSLAKDPHRRYQTVVELRDALAAMQIEPKSRLINQVALLVVIILSIATVLLLAVLRT